MAPTPKRTVRWRSSDQGGNTAVLEVPNADGTVSSLQLTLEEMYTLGQSLVQFSATLKEQRHKKKSGQAGATRAQIALRVKSIDVKTDILRESILVGFLNTEDLLTHYTLNLAQSESLCTLIMNNLRQFASYTKITH